jgi:hypothetical protein
MGDTDRDPHPYSPPHADNDRRSDLEKAVSGGGEDVEAVPDDAETTPLDVTGVHSNSGTSGVTKDQKYAEQ